MENDDFNIVEYLEQFQKDVVDRLVDLSINGDKDAAVKLKANQILFNKFIPDKQKLELTGDMDPMSKIQAMIKDK